MLDGHSAGVFCEGEFDTMLLWQEARHLVGTATLGSCNKGLPAAALPYLLPIHRLFITYGADPRGDEGAARLLALPPRMTRIRPPVGGDLTGFVKAGGRLLDWVSFHLARVEMAS